MTPTALDRGEPLGSRSGNEIHYPHFSIGGFCAVCGAVAPCPTERKHGND